VAARLELLRSDSAFLLEKRSIVGRLALVPSTRQRASIQPIVLVSRKLQQEC